MKKHIALVALLLAVVGCGGPAPPTPRFAIGDEVQTVVDEQPGQVVQRWYTRGADGEWIYEVRLPGGHTHSYHAFELEEINVLLTP